MIGFIIGFSIVIFAFGTYKIVKGALRKNKKKKENI